ncbi:MAG: Flp family type IVb pilin [Roseinatronobacter sp.]
MKMSLSYFLRAEDGAVTVDWVVLTAALVGMGLTSVAAVRTGTSSLGDAIGTSLMNYTMPHPWTLDVSLVAHAENVRLQVAGFGDNCLRMHWYWWEEKRGVYSDNSIAMQQQIGLEELAKRGLTLEAPEGATRCDQLHTMACWN